jgi:hypothetical protein
LRGVGESGRVETVITELTDVPDRQFGQGARALCPAPLGRIVAVGLIAVGVAIAGCQTQEVQEPAVATPSVTFNHGKAPAGSPVEITYKFVVAAGATLDRNYRVMAQR